jgi:predicted nucleic acid-binding protein
MSYVADSNILLRIIQYNHPMHEEALRAVVNLLRQDEVVHVLPQNLYEVWVVATRPLANNGLGLTAQEARREISGIESLFAYIPDTPAIYPAWKGLVTQHSVLGRAAHDARIVAVMQVYGISHILTFNKDDFKRFPSITVVTPAEIN